MCTQYFDLQSRTVGMYGYDWIEHDGHSIRKHLSLIVTKYADGELEPAYLDVAVKKQNDSNDAIILLLHDTNAQRQVYL